MHLHVGQWKWTDTELDCKIWIIFLTGILVTSAVWDAGRETHPRCSSGVNFTALGWKERSRGERCFLPQFFFGGQLWKLSKVSCQSFRVLHPWQAGTSLCMCEKLSFTLFRQKNGFFFYREGWVVGNQELWRLWSIRKLWPKTFWLLHHG